MKNEKNFLNFFHPRYSLGHPKMLIGSICQKSFQILENFCTFFAKFLHIFAKILQNFLKHFFQKKKGTRGHQSLKLQPLLDKKH